MKGQMVYLNKDGTDNRVLGAAYVNVVWADVITNGPGWYAEDELFGKASQMFYPERMFRFEQFDADMAALAALGQAASTARAPEVAAIAARYNELKGTDR